MRPRLSRRRRHQPEDEDVGADEQHDEALDHQRQVAGELRLEDLRVEVPRRRPVEERAEQERGEPDADRRVAPEQRDRDADEADLDVWTSPVASRNCQPRMSIAPARPAKRARDRHREEVVARDADAAVARGLRVEADRAHLVAERRAVEDEPVDDERADRDEEARRAGPAAPGRPRRPAASRPRRRRSRSGRTPGVGVLQRPAEPEEEDADPDGDPVEHDRRDHLVGADGRLQEAGDARPERPAAARPRSSRRARGAAGHAGERGADPDRAARRPTMYWPWPPMLKRPQRKANATARPVRISVVVAMQRLLEVERRQAALVAGHPREEPVEAGARRRSPGRSRAGSCPVVTRTTRPPMRNASTP